VSLQVTQNDLTDYLYTMNLS